MCKRALAVLGLVFAGLASAQDQLPGSTWSSIAELPKFVGVWEVGGGGPPQQMSLTGKFAAIQKAYQQHPAEDSPAANCVPPGMPGIMGQPYPIEFLFTPGKV